MSKRIGVTSNVADGELSVRIELLSYLTFHGYTPVVLTPGDERCLEGLDGLLLGGGPDLNPLRYSSSFVFEAGRPSPALEWFDNILLPRAIGKIPVFGICRGMQAINVYFGGTLNQHIDTHPYSASGDDLVHVIVADKHPHFKTNSFHHQGIEALGEGINVLATEKNEGLVEAIFRMESGKMISGVQWHPERSDNMFSALLLKRTFGE